ncbi:class II aaRS and biotin synthetase [Neoconidiobolus thromboides FSU 785]|nr:class II aaRS and biotin synthetase [Neoconidiobolus thromboides FSU 785]
MFKTFLDPIDPLQRLIESPNPKETLEQINNTSVVYLRPETAQGVFINYLYCLRFAGNKIPFGVAQLGKSFRNELRVEHMIFRTLEFEQMELQFFTLPKKANEWFDVYVQKRMDWWFELVNNKELFRKRNHEDKELAHYAKACTDVEFMFPWGWGELEGIANRGDFDLKSHMNAYVIESSSGLNRACLAILLDAFTIQQDRIILKLNPKIAPIKVGICPLINKEEFNNIAEQLNSQFLIRNISTRLLNQQLKIGKKYYRMDEIGTPYCITIDYQTLEDETVTIRFRDTQKQIRVNINQVVNHIHEALNADILMKL